MTTTTFPCAACCPPEVCTDSLSASPCQQGTTREVTLTVEPREYIARIGVYGARLKFSGSFIHFTDPADVTVDYGSGPMPITMTDGIGSIDICKPQGVTSVTINIGAVYQTVGVCQIQEAPELVGPECDCARFYYGSPGEFTDSPAWSLTYGCLVVGECSPPNPLP